jgi:transposase
MIPIASGVRVWVATGHTDMRRGMNSLALLVQEGFHRDPHGGDLYVFRGKSGQRTIFYIQLAIRDDCLPLASPVRADVASVAVPARQGFEVHLHGRAA